MCVDDGVVADDDATCVLKSDSCLGPFVPVIQWQEDQTPWRDQLMNSPNEGVFFYFELSYSHFRDGIILSQWTRNLYSRMKVAYSSTHPYFPPHKRGHTNTLWYAPPMLNVLAFKRVVDGVLLVLVVVGASQVPQENYDGEVMHN